MLGVLTEEWSWDDILRKIEGSLFRQTMRYLGKSQLTLDFRRAVQINGKARPLYSFLYEYGPRLCPGYCLLQSTAPCI